MSRKNGSVRLTARNRPLRACSRSVRQHDSSFSPNRGYAHLLCTVAVVMPSHVIHYHGYVASPIQAQKFPAPPPASASHIFTGIPPL